MARGILITASFILALGLAAGGYFIGDGFYKARTGDRFVTVRGLAERAVEADLAVWPMRFMAAGADLAQTQTKLAKDGAAIRAFLARHGFEETEIADLGLQVRDNMTDPYRQGTAANRFVIDQTLQVRTAKIDAVAKALAGLGDVVREGVVLMPDFGGPSYIFTGLDAIKPAMVAAATRDARGAAEQFAADSGAKVGSIRRASQGYFSIQPRDGGGSYEESRARAKTVRVVTTIDFFLTE